MSVREIGEEDQDREEGEEEQQYYSVEQEEEAEPHEWYLEQYQEQGD